MLFTLSDLTDSSSDEDDCSVHHDPVQDHRFTMLSVDSQYCNLDEFGAAVETLGTAQYCALHLNIHSLPSKIIQLREMLFSLKEQGITIHFILLCETFLSNANAHLFPIAGYNFVHKSRSQLTRGGVAIYILDGFNYTERLDLCINVEGEFESIAVEIKPKHNKPHIIVTEIYRIPNTSERMSIERFDQIVTALSNSQCDIIIGSDQNIDYKNVSTNTNASNLLDIFFTSGILPTIKRPTRITHTSATIIDNLYVKCNGYINIDSRIILSDISDHLPIITGMGKSQVTNAKAPLIFCHRPIDSSQLCNMTNTLNSTNWEDIIGGESDVSKSYDNFIEHFGKVLDEHVPMRKIVIPHRSIIREPWMTSDLLKSSRKRDILYKKTIGQVKSSKAYIKYLDHRNKHNNFKRHSKNIYYENLLNKYNKDIRKTWQVLNTITGRVHDKSGISDMFVINGERIYDKAHIADQEMYNPCNSYRRCFSILTMSIWKGLIQQNSWGFTLIHTLHGKIILSIVDQNYQAGYML